MIPKNPFPLPVKCVCVCLFLCVFVTVAKDSVLESVCGGGRTRVSGVKGKRCHVIVPGFLGRSVTV